VWFVVLHGEPARPLILDELSRTMTEVEHRAPPHLDVYLFERR
jgi:hypothetical protein